MEGDQTHEWSTKQETTVEVLFMIDGCMFLVILVYASYVLIKYILMRRGEQRRTKFYLMFYFLVLAVCLCQMTQVIQILLHPSDHDFFLDFDIFQSLTRCCRFALGWMISATMFQLTISIREIFNLVNSRLMQWYTRVFYFFCLVASFLLILDIFLIPALSNEKEHRIYCTIINLIVSYSLLTIIQTSILILLIWTLKRMNRLGTFSNTTKNILMQFGLFLFSYIVNLTLSAQFLITSNHDGQTGIYSSDPKMIAPLLIACVYMPIDILPITFMLCSHHRTFKAEESKPSSFVHAMQPSQMKESLLSKSNAPSQLTFSCDIRDKQDQTLTHTQQDKTQNDSEGRISGSFANNEDNTFAEPPVKKTSH